MTEETDVADAGDAMNDVFSSGRDRSGKSAPPEPRAEPTPEPAPKADTQPAPEGNQEGTEDGSPTKDPFNKYRDPESGRLVPLNELKSEREKRQEATRKFEEAEKKAKEAEARYAELERKLQAAQQPQFQPQQQPQRQQPQRQRPDPWTDPEGAMAFDREMLSQHQHLQVFETRVALSEEMMAAKPDYAEKKAIFLEAARAQPHLAQQMVQHPLPAKFVYEQGKRIMAEQEVGNDLDAYNKRIEERVRQQVLEELKAGTTVNAQPQKFPGTLADATPSGSDQGAHLTDEAVMGNVFSSNRRRK